MKNKIYTMYKSIAVLGLAMLFACEEISMKDIQDLQPPDLSKYPSTTMENIKIVYFDSGKSRVTIRAPRLDIYDHPKNSYNEFTQGLDVVFFNDSITEGTLKAKYAISKDVGKKLYEARGHVVVVNKDGDSLVSDHLIWDMISKKIYNEIPTDLYMGGSHIYSFKGLEATQDLSEYTLKENSGTILFKENEL